MAVATVDDSPALWNTAIYEDWASRAASKVMPIIDANQLTHTQRRVMQYLAHGHRATRQYGSVVYVNGGKIATVATMEALERRKLVIRDGDQWMALAIVDMNPTTNKV